MKIQLATNLLHALLTHVSGNIPPKFPFHKHGIPVIIEIASLPETMKKQQFQITPVKFTATNRLVHEVPPNVVK